MVDALTRGGASIHAGLDLPLSSMRVAIGFFILETPHAFPCCPGE